MRKPHGINFFYCIEYKDRIKIIKQLKSITFNGIIYYQSHIIVLLNIIHYVKHISLAFIISNYLMEK